MSRDSPTAAAPERILVGISACLLGQEVRFDGGHKQDRFLTETLGPFLQWVPVCPEVELGLGTPREPIRLEQQDVDVRMITIPLTLIRHYVRLFDVTYFKGQAYLNPHPKELGLRNHV